ncbi:helix-turn-helix domain-containing protein [Chengkuizengella axinellae]|uniref:AraC family transcriptional regulator n=1 Tax=Chengkuizengella axinellae TaxID=3064388 RepID=A0ABT9J125_9BACL|nr:AraC family transcriptional regulator [Chengkuizengella sp. 2205SS18-9]MDP5275292.1 AraC family transcriptional regulator [Chengkuizengella sp. 2205SS18-9]
MLQLQTEAFEVTRYFAKITCEPEWKWIKRDVPLPHYDLFYVWDGVGEVIVNDQSHEVLKGSCFLFRPGDFTSAVHDPQNPLTITYIHFSVDQKPERIPARYRMIKNTMDFQTILTSYVRLMLNEDEYTVHEAQLILKQLMIHLFRSDQVSSHDVQTKQHHLKESIFEVANYIHEHPSEWFSLDELAARAQISPRYFSLKFKELIGKSVREYMIESRIERAEYLLYYTGMNVTEVAGALGYEDIYFFSKQFKKYRGYNPSTLK